MKMKCVHTTIVRPAHGYTRSSTPWLLDANLAAKGETTTGLKFGWKLFHYISGGCMRVFGRTVEQEEADARQNRFLWAMGAVFALWLAFYFI